jgi:5-methylcytosine-specific restriction protein A
LKRFYDSALWAQVRARQLRDHPLCCRCETNGLTVAATEVDHRIPIRAGGDRTDPANLNSMCTPCHSRKTLAETRGVPPQ